MTDHDTSNEQEPNEDAGTSDQSSSAPSGYSRGVLAIGAVVMLTLGGLGGALLADIAQHDEPPTIERAGYAKREMGRSRGMHGDDMRGAWGEGRGMHGYGRGMHGDGRPGDGVSGMRSERGEHRKLMKAHAGMATSMLEKCDE